MEFATLIRFTFTALALSLCGVGCVSQAAPPPSPEEVEAFQGKPMPESVREKMRASQTAAPIATPSR